jgi:hypothetical protein
MPVPFSRSGGFGAGLLGQALAEANASGKTGALHLRLGEIQQAADHRRRITFHIVQKEEQALVGRQVAHRDLEIGTANVAVTKPDAGSDDRRGFFLLQRKSLVQLSDERRIDCESIGLFVLLEGSDKGGGENFFRFDFIAGHVEGERKGTMTVAFIDVSLLLLTGLFDSLRGNDIRFRGKLALKIEQSYPNLGKPSA